MTPLAPTTELDAVNIMLSTIGESPVNSLSGESSSADVAIAKQVLREITIAVLTPGWHFNTESNYPLTPSLDTGEIAIPFNCLEIDTAGLSGSVDVAQRGARLYNRGEWTYRFTQTIYVDMVVALPFDELPQSARRYISIRAARVFQARQLGSETIAGYTERDEQNAWAAFQRANTNNADLNILSGSWSVARILTR